MVGWGFDFPMGLRVLLLVAVAAAGVGQSG